MFVLKDRQAGDKPEIDWTKNWKLQRNLPQAKEQHQLPEFHINAAASGIPQLQKKDTVIPTKQLQTNLLKKGLF